MAVGWARDGAVQEQMDADVDDAVKRVRSQLPLGESLTHCVDCDKPIPEARRRALPGVRRCVDCQERLESRHIGTSGYNRRGSKGSQMK